MMQNEHLMNGAMRASHKVVNAVRGLAGCVMIATALAACGGVEPVHHAPMPSASSHAAPPETESPSEAEQALDDAMQERARSRETRVAGPEQEPQVEEYTQDPYPSDPESQHETGPRAPCAAPGEMGCMCRGGGDCHSGRCEWDYCTAECDVQDAGSCAGDWRCVALSHGPALCAPPLVSLCWPCETDAECADTEAWKARCVGLGEFGSFCTTSCVADEDCPTGFVCSAADDGAEPACVPDGFECDCGGYDIPADWDRTTTCQVSNEWGTCAGERWCEAGELAACSADEPIQELCNGIDDNCDGQIDEPPLADCTTYYKDDDGDGAGVGDDAQCLCAPAKPHTATEAGDCDDLSALVGPNRAEKCSGVDDNCNGEIDEEGAQGCTVFYSDQDGDGFGSSAEGRCLCVPDGIWSALKVGDCNDANPLVFPGATESCNGTDDNCDGVVDEMGAVGCTDYYLDADGDGFGTWSPKCLCAAEGAFSATKAGDCNDSDKFVHPGAQEKCNGVDDNCNGLIDEEGAQGCKSHYLDSDGDGHGTSANLCLCKPQGNYNALKTGDCNDNNPAIFPGAQEACDDIDNNCNGAVDENCDADGDGWCSVAKLVATPSPAVCPKGGNDCNDFDPAVNPGASDWPDIEFKDNNCDGVDGNLSHGIFVHPTLGNDLHSGEPNKPVRTIPAALARSKVKNNAPIYLGAGTYSGKLSINQPAFIYGGYQLQSNGQWTRSASAKSKIANLPGTSSHIAAIEANDAAVIVLQLVHVESGSASGNGSSYGIWARNTGVNLQHSHVIAGNGSDGPHGQSGNSITIAAASGWAGSLNGAPGLPGIGCSSGGKGGGGGTPSGISGSAGSPGGFSLNSAGVPIQAAGGGGGNLTNCGLAAAGAGLNGLKGHDGVPGTGASAPTLTSTALFEPGSGNNGVSGASGGGGGGGGGGKGVGACDSCYACGSSCKCVTQTGGGGGGGGAGGCGGAGGGGGASGGGSFGVYAVNSAVLLEGGSITTGKGGNGGVGAQGGNGQKGGAGGEGGAGFGPASSGGKGGTGGDGGKGGPGAGGNGGPSVGVALWGSASYNFTKVQPSFTIGSGGDAGVNGAGVVGTGSAKGINKPTHVFYGSN